MFVGPCAPVAVGDYGIGPNHVLPTGGAARYASPLSVRDFQRRQSRVRLTRAGLRRVAEDVVRVARPKASPATPRACSTRFEALMSDPLAPRQAGRARAARPTRWPRARRPVKINQNENPFDLPEALKRRVLEQALARPWARYPDFDPRELLEALAAFARLARGRHPGRQRLQRADRGAAPGDGGRGHARS